MNPIQAIRGMNDIFPPEIFLWQYADEIIRSVLHTYGYQEIRFPILEKTELFKRSIGEATDIVEKEMYTFLDRNNENLTLRPEGTASCVRAGIEHGLLYNQVQRFWYSGPNFRYERPQKGRCRQFYQYGAEVFGIGTPDIDAELILLSAKILEKLGLKSYVTLQLNSLGSPASRKAYREKLVTYFSDHQTELDEDSKKRLLVNPLRILDSKNPAMQSLISNAPQLLEHLDSESELHFHKLRDYLTAAGLDFVVNPRLVRGLDYYTKTVFEWVTDHLGAQGTVCAGGRYDGLVEELGGKATPALGFAMGMERLILLLQQIQPVLPDLLDIYVITTEDAFTQGLKLSDLLREAIPGLRVLLHTGGGNFKNQFKKADKSGAKFALVIGDDELKNNSVSIKSLREETQQVTVGMDEIVENMIKAYT